MAIEKARLCRQLLHELRFHPALQANEPMFPCIMEQVIEDDANRGALGSNLEHIANGAWHKTVDVPTDDLPFFIADQASPEFPESFPLSDEIEYPV